MPAVLEERADVIGVRPVYYEDGGGPESAASPLLDTLVIGVAEGQEATALGFLGELGLEHNAGASERLGPYHLLLYRPQPGKLWPSEGWTLSKASPKCPVSAL